MHYVSTRGRVPPATLTEAIAAGAAADGGLFVPSHLPRVETGRSPGDGSLPASAEMVLMPFFAGDALEPELGAICGEAFAFESPLLPLSSPTDLVLQLFQGSTAAFKDFGARFLASCLRRIRRLDERLLTVLVATSGDTGSAVAAAFHRSPGVRVILLYPDGRVSPRQAHLLGCFGDNVTALRVAGSFDDCQQAVKAAFADRELTDRLQLTSANSISLGRLLPQLALYAHAAWTHNAPLNFVVPTGNLGNGLAAVWAREMGVPIGEVILATNANRVLADFFEGRPFSPRPSVSTLATAMDVGAPSNFERMRWTFRTDAGVRSKMTAVVVTDEEIEEAIRHGERRHGQVFCPHTATAVRLLENLRSAGDRRSWAVVATAHPAKFETVVEPLVGHTVEVPEALVPLLARSARAELIEAGPNSLRTWLLDRLESSR